MEVLSVACRLLVIGTIWCICAHLATASLSMPAPAHLPTPVRLMPPISAIARMLPQLVSDQGILLILALAVLPTPTSTRLMTPMLTFALLPAPISARLMTPMFTLAILPAPISARSMTPMLTLAILPAPISGRWMFQMPREVHEGDNFNITCEDDTADKAALLVRDITAGTGPITYSYVAEWNASTLQTFNTDARRRWVRKDIGFTRNGPHQMIATFYDAQCEDASSYRFMGWGKQRDRQQNKDLSVLKKNGVGCMSNRAHDRRLHGSSAITFQSNVQVKKGGTIKLSCSAHLLQTEKLQRMKIYKQDILLGTWKSGDLDKNAVYGKTQKMTLYHDHVNYGDDRVSVTINNAGCGDGGTYLCVAEWADGVVGGQGSELKHETDAIAEDVSVGGCNVAFMTSVSRPVPCIVDTITVTVLFALVLYSTD